MNGSRVVMHRQPVSAIVDDVEKALFVVCNDGAVFCAMWTAEGKLVGWHEVPPVPGTERVAPVQGRAPV